MSVVFRKARDLRKKGKKALAPLSKATLKLKAESLAEVQFVIDSCCLFIVAAALAKRYRYLLT